MSDVFETQEDRHDRAIARRPSAAVWALGQHRLQLTKLPICRVDHNGEPMIASMFGGPRVLF